MIQDFDHFTEFGFNDYRLNRVSGNNFGLAFATEEKWRKLKPMLSPLFSPKQLRLMSQNINRFSKETIKVLGQESASAGPEGIKVDDIINRHLLNTITTISLGIEVDAHENPDNELSNLTSKLFSDTWRMLGAEILPAIMYYLDIPTTNPKAYAIIERLTKEVLKAVENGSSNVGVLKEIVRIRDDPKNGDRHFLDEDMIVGTVIQFFTDGYETVASNIIFALYHLAMNPHIQEQAFEEIEDIGENINEENVNQLKYMEQIFQESNRITTFPYTARTCTKEWQIPETKIRVPVGTRLVIPLIGIQNDPQYFENPDVFDPDRFSSENRSKIATCTYMPFGEGPRRCAGMNLAKLQARIIIFHILKNFKITAVDKTPKNLWEENVWSTSNFLPMLTDGLWVKLEKR